MTNVSVSIPKNWHLSLDSLDIPGLTVYEWDTLSEPPAEQIDIVVGPHVTTGNPLETVAQVKPKLIQLGSIGHDTIPAVVPDGIQVANAASVHETATAEHTLAMLLYLARDFRRSVDQQKGGYWKPYYSTGLADSHVLQIGVGGVGTAITERLAPFEVELTRVATRARSDNHGHIHGIDELPTLLPEADVVIVVVPHNESTDRLINDEFLSAMKDESILINVARGKVADTDALLKHADRLRLGLDVTDPEPLPEGHPLFEKAALVTPHIGGNTMAMHRRMEELIRRQIGRYISGEPFVNIVRG